MSRRFEKNPQDRSEYMFRMQFNEPIPNAKGKIMQRGYRQEDRKDKNPKAQAFFGDASVFGSKSEAGVEYFARESN
mgnify:FL=1